MSKNAIKVGDIEFEPEVLNSLTEPSNVKFARAELFEFASTRWGWDEAASEFMVRGLKDKKEYKFFNELYWKIVAILSSDKNTIFEEVGVILDLARTKPTDFEKIYQAVVEANPTLAREVTKVPKEGEPNPNESGPVT
jgi:hypothetical protein